VTDEILWIAFELARIPYSFVGSSPGALGYIEDDQKLCNPKPLHFHQQARGVTSDSMPTWFEGPLVLDVKHDFYFRPTSWVSRGKWEPQQTQWCVSGSDPIPLEMAQHGNHSLTSVFDELIASNIRSNQRYQGLLSYFSDV